MDVGLLSKPSGPLSRTSSTSEYAPGLAPRSFECIHEGAARLPSLTVFPELGHSLQCGQSLGGVFRLDHFIEYKF